ncbi:transcription elongation factor GreAB [Oceanicoccus sp. KOV_DT_Chl]|uniref:GreA/GreB family elongation factor n=1 Tax=Oceanicoccus sp. KOV_DT_Chl TaxID=1904639 RepID=UPI000C7A8A15|nr:transcription elongation factor GreAB [Oceanicoccus sp. KOV_DT_Chl]
MHYLVSQIIQQLQSELNTAIAASQQAHASATDNENVAENKYDTLAVEAAYLAHGQSMRIAELQQAILSYQQFQPAEFNQQSTIALGALVSVENNNTGKIQQVFLGPAAGGLLLTHNHKTIHLITRTAPLALALLGKNIDGEIQLNSHGQLQDFTIVDIQ